MTRHNITPSDFTDKTVLSFNGAIFFYPEQIIPVFKYCEHENFKPLVYTGPERILSKGVNGHEVNIKAGSKLSLDVSTPKNCSPNSANAYKLIVENGERQTYVPILNLIPESLPGGVLDDKLHYDAITQLKNLHKVLFERHETEYEFSERKTHVVAEFIPETDFYIGKPYNSRSGYDISKVLFKDGKYLRLRDKAWVSLKELQKHSASYKTEQDAFDFNVWGEYENKYDMAWHVQHNACVIAKTKEGINQSNWDKQFDKYRDETIKRYVK